MRSFSLWASVVLFFLSHLLAAAQEHSARDSNTRDRTRLAAGETDASNAGPCTDRKLARYRASPNSTGETVEGGVCAEAAPVNTLRNFIYISTTITQTAGPSPGSIFPASGQLPQFSRLPGGQPPLTLEELEPLVQQAEAALRMRQDDNRAAASKLEDVLARLKEFIVHSDERALSVSTSHR